MQTRGKNSTQKGSQTGDVNKRLFYWLSPNHNNLILLNSNIPRWFMLLYTMYQSDSCVKSLVSETDKNSIKTLFTQKQKSQFQVICKPYFPDYKSWSIPQVASGCLVFGFLCNKYLKIIAIYRPMQCVLFLFMAFFWQMRLSLVQRIVQKIRYRHTRCIWLNLIWFYQYRYVEWKSESQ